jgi:hypothetical protein
MYEVGKHIDDQSTGTRLVIEAVEKAHVLCRVELVKRAKAPGADAGERRSRPMGKRPSA